MNSPPPANPELSQSVRNFIRDTFPPGEQATVTELVRTFHYAPGPAVDERIHLDLLELSAGNLERLRQLVEYAQRDWRDLILAAEYDVIGEKIVQNERGKRRLEEFAERKRKGEFSSPR
jgi:hypothetical protein